MGKRRTRREKEEAHHQFTVSWQPQTQRLSEPSVKGQFKKPPEPKNFPVKASKSADILAKDGSFEATRRDIIKSLILASLILALELVIYLAWSRKA